MNTVIKILFISIIFTLTSVSASESGLLLGMRYGTHYDISAKTEQNVFQKRVEPSVYRTFWIRADNGQVELAAERTNLLVPRSDGFWRIDVKHSAYNDFTEDFIWVNPAPDHDAIPNPFLAEQEGINAFDVSLLVKRQGKEQGIDTTHGEYCEGHAYRDILFVGNNHLSVGYTHSEICRGFFMSSATDSALQMLSLEQLAPIEISTLLNAKDRTTLKNAAKEFQDKNTGIEEWGELSGGVVRYQGRWIIKGHYPINERGYTQFEIPIATPKSLVFHDGLYPDWQTIKKQVPDAIDAFSSQAKDLLVVLTSGGHLLAFTLLDGKISQKPALHILFKQPVTLIMARWAEGQYVSNWTQEIQNLGPKPQKSWFTHIEIPTVEEAPKTVGIVVTQNTNLNLRQGIGQHTKPIAKVQKGTKVKLLDVLGQWYKVQLDNGLTGYAQSDYVKLLPKLPYVKSACPIDNCTYGQWTLSQLTTLYATPSFKGDSLGSLKAKQTVQAVHGKIHTSQFGEIEVTQSEVKLTDDNQDLTLHQGDRLFDLEPVGLGMHVVWYNGELYYLNNAWEPKIASGDLWGKLITERKTDWWVKVDVPEKNLSGWIVNPNAAAINRRN
ncbi:MAG: hypothetical protein DRQ49_06290 [Gammaproteobacteria bacterium]|nr:MAG: hypothetical protein DRQ49_06290 [Gammaproteobacteria bacterium]RKZ42235.1 MAG: hypothetical protein DRQ41_07235 [Gammaproteobacteria bacterium]RKZ75884.1 MAG: hypothetical protein DRQ57_05860 [Gammaproteobacteria bacterium]